MKYTYGVIAFLQALYPDAPNLAMASFSTDAVLGDATQLIVEQRQEIERLRAERDALLAEISIVFDDPRLDFVTAQISREVLHIHHAGSAGLVRPEPKVEP